MNVGQGSRVGVWDTGEGDTGEGEGGKAGLGGEHGQVEKSLR